VDLTLTKGFGLPNMPVLGENAKFELRMDACNVFNNLNFNPNLEISNNIDSANLEADCCRWRLLLRGGSLQDPLYTPALA